MRPILKKWLASFIVVSGLVGIASLAHSAETLRIGQSFMTNGLDPAKGSNGWALASHGVGENLYTVNQAGELVPELAQTAERIDDLNWKITLKKDRSFSDGTPVTAKAIASGFDNTFALNKAAHATGGLIKFETPDDLTLMVNTEKPVALIQALFAEWPLIVYKLNDKDEAVYTGAYAISAFKADTSLDLIANPHFEGAEKRSPVHLQKFGDSQSLALAFESGELDLAFGLPTETLPRLKNNPDLVLKSFDVGYQYFAFLNTSRPALQDVQVRRAIDLALDRTQLIQSINDGNIATGAYAAYFPFAMKEPRVTDLAEAEKILDNAGWVKNASGIREKDGKPLSLLVATYSQRADFVTMIPVMKSALMAMGAQVETKIVENGNEYGAEGDFDVFLWALHTAPTGDPAFFLNSMLRTGASLNFSRYASSAFDTIIDGFASETDMAKRVDIARLAQEKLFEDVPASFLVSLVWTVGLSKRLENYQPWGSDYHVLRADMGE